MMSLSPSSSRASMLSWLEFLLCWLTISFNTERKSEYHCCCPSASFIQTHAAMYFYFLPRENDSCNSHILRTWNLYAIGRSSSRWCRNSTGWSLLIEYLCIALHNVFGKWWSIINSCLSILHFRCCLDCFYCSANFTRCAAFRFAFEHFALFTRKANWILFVCLVCRMRSMINLWHWILSDWLC